MLDITFIRESGKVSLRFLSIAVTAIILLVVVGVIFWTREIKPITDVETLSKEKAVEEAVFFEQKTAPKEWSLLQDNDGWSISFPPSFEVREFGLQEGNKDVLFTGILPNGERTVISVNSKTLETAVEKDLLETVRTQWGLKGPDMILAVQRLGVRQSPDSYPEGLSHIVIDRKIEVGGRIAAQFGVRESDYFLLRTSFFEKDKIVDITVLPRSLEEGELVEIYNTMISSFSFN